MHLLTILACLFAERYLTGLPQLRDPHWIERWIELHQSLPIPSELRQGRTGWATLLLPPLLALGLAQWLLGGLLGFLFGIVVLLYTLGPGDLEAEVREFLEAHENGPPGRIRAAREVLLNHSQSTQGESARRLAAGVFTSALRRTFGVLLGFLALGPVGALAYRMGCELQAQARRLSYSGLQTAADEGLWLLDWLPSHLLAGLFALAGDFEGALQAWRQGDHPHGHPDAASAMLVSTGLAALQFDARPQPDGDSPETEVFAVKAAQGLVGRSLVLLIAELALITLASGLL